MKNKLFFKNLIKYLKNKNSPLSTFEYINPGDHIGYKILKFLINKKNFLSIFIFLVKNFLSLFIQNYHFVFNKDKKKISFKKVIITWGFEENFDANGNFRDKYLNIRSNKTTKEYLWIVVYLDKKLPNKISSNVLIYKEIKKKISFFNFFSSIIKIFKSSEKDILLTIKSLNKNSIFAINFREQINNVISFNKTKKLFFVYEGQPYQKYLIEGLKKQNLKIYGILHHPPHSLLFNFFYQKNITPHKLIVSGKLTKDILIKKYNWKKENIISLPSFRNKKKKKNKKEIFISSNIYNRLKVVKYLEQTVESLKYNIADYKVSFHPNIKKNKFDKSFENQINEIKSNSSKFNYKPRNVNFCIGVSSVIIELLESGIKVIHVTEVPTIEKYDNHSWKYINIKKITNKSFMYSLKKNNAIHHIKNRNSLEMINKL